MKSFFEWCRRYLSVVAILAIAFMAYMLFFQDNSVFRYNEYSNTIDSLRSEIKKYDDTARIYHELNERLSRDPETMERIVREHYNMNREGEDVYIFQ